MNKGLLLYDNNIQRRSLSYKFLAIDLHREKVIQLISEVHRCRCFYSVFTFVRSKKYRTAVEMEILVMTACGPDL